MTKTPQLEPTSLGPHTHNKTREEVSFAAPYQHLLPLFGNHTIGRPRLHTRPTHILPIRTQRRPITLHITLLHRPPHLRTRILKQVPEEGVGSSIPLWLFPLFRILDRVFFQLVPVFGPRATTCGIGDFGGGRGFCFLGFEGRPFCAAGGFGEFEGEFGGEDCVGRCCGVDRVG